MTRYYAGIAVLAALVACGDGNPFTTTTTGTPATPGAAVPEAISSDLDGFSYNPTTGQLMITGVYLDNVPTTVSYTRKPGLDVPGYIAYAVQEDPLDQHVTAYVQQVGQVTGVVAVAGGQFGYYNGGARYTRTGAYDPLDVTPTTGLVSYAGDYVGLSNVDGPGGDLLPVPGGTPTSILPGQAGVVTGDVFINVDFADSQLKGSVYDRQIVTGGGTVALPDFVLVPTELTTDGTFAGTVEIPTATGLQSVGEYGGIIGGPDGESMAGGVFAGEHFDDAGTGEEEYGLFVLGRCGGALENSPLCATVNP